MDNPYAAHDLTPELVEEERQRPKMWRALLVAYAVHHGFGVLGLFAGLAANPTQWSLLNNPCAVFLMLAGIPMLDLFLLLAPFSTGLGHPVVETGWMPSVLVLTIPVASMVFAISRRRAALVYVGVVSFVVSMSFVFAMAVYDRIH